MYIENQGLYEIKKICFKMPEEKHIKNCGQ